MSYSVLTPYLLPPEWRHRKKANIGDGFILNRIVRLLQPASCIHVFSTRTTLSDEDVEKINSTKALILAGANQLNDDFSIVPDFDLSRTLSIKVPIVPFGIGVSGEKNRNRKMSEKTKSILRELHGRIRYSSWRCPLTVEYLTRYLPEVADRFVLTGCPVIYDEKLLNGTPFGSHDERVVVTVTERGDFWEREAKTIDFVSRKFEKSEKRLSLHRSYPDVSKWSAVFQRRRYLQRKKIVDLHNYARDRGFTVVVPESVESCMAFYQGSDLHMGSRLHAHLFFLSQAKRSFLTYVDERMKGFSDMLEFPLCDYNRFDDYMEYDFERYRRRCLEHYETMKRFVHYLKKELL